jgi:hypothetical protein
MAVGAIVTYFWPDTCLNRVIPYQVILVAGANFLMIGIPMLIVAAMALTRNYDRNQVCLSYQE